jgi:small subunit ribosomal protein S17
MEKTLKRTLSGEIIKKSSKNTLKVRIEHKQAHPIYKKVVAFHRNYLVDCSDKQFEAAQVGDSVTIQETRPISKLKTWKLVSTDKKAEQE